MAPILRSAIVVASIALAIRPGRGQDAERTSTAPESLYALVTTSAKHVRVDLTFEFVAPKVKAKEWAVYTIRLPELTSQTEVRSALSPGGHSARELRAAGRPVLFARIPVKGPKGRDGLTVRVEYEANLLARRLVQRQPGTKAATPVAPLPQKERRLALADGRQFDFRSPSFQRWLDAHKLRRAPKEGEIDFARRVFLEIKSALYPAHGVNLDRLASHVCTAGMSDSGGLSIVFTSALRANGIPARVSSGRWARDSEPGRNAADEPHVMAAFFAAGVGWVPVDIGSAMILDKSSDGLEFFGTDNADFLIMHFDTDLEFDTVFFGRKTVEFVQGPVYWVTGPGSLDDFKELVTSKIQTEPLDLSRPFPKPSARRPEPNASSQENTKNQHGVGITGILTDRQDTWIMVKADGEDEAVRYIVGEGADKSLPQELQSIFTVNRVRLVYTLEGDSRQLISIKKQPTNASGTVTGQVLQNHTWWIEVKPTTGPPDGYAAHFPFDQSKEVVQTLEGLKRGDIVTIRFTTDSERHRIESIRKKR
jgi:transglutaminase superfamily protein